VRYAGVNGVMMTELSVLHISTADQIGGSARSAYNIHDGLRRRGFRSRMLVGTMASSDPDVGLISSGALKFLDRLADHAMARLSLPYVYFPSSRRLLRHPWFVEADIVQIYNTHGGYFSHTVLPAVSSGKHAVWRLSDMWPMTGHCVYPDECRGWLDGCSPCPYLDRYVPLRSDRAGFLWQQKKRTYGRSELHIVAPTNWIMDAAQQSPLLGRFPCRLIPNGVDMDVFRPVPKGTARGALDVPGDRTALLFIAHVLQNNPRKGTQYVPEIVSSLWEAGRRDILLMLVGQGEPEWIESVPCPVWRRDLVRDDELLALVYSAADVNLHPAVVENFPNTVLEAMACGLPSVAFDVGGVSDGVVDGVTGRLVQAGDVHSFVRAVEAIVDSKELRQKMSAGGIEFVRENMTVQKQADAFADLCRSVISR